MNLPGVVVGRVVVDITVNMMGKIIRYSGKGTIPTIMPLKLPFRP